MNFFANPGLFPSKIAITLIKLYQAAISPWVGRHCRFSPSCSEYSRDAFENHGLWQAVRLSLFRISKCHPFNPGGYDPVPK